MLGSPYVPERPARVPAQVTRVGVVDVRLAGGSMPGSPYVPERHERVPAQVARVVAGHVEPVVPDAELLVGGLQPVHERDVRLGGRGGRLSRPALLDPAVPGADVLADVAAVDAVP